MAVPPRSGVCGPVFGDGLQGGIELVGSFPEMAEHERDASRSAHGIGHTLASDVRCATADRLEHRRSVRSIVGARRDTEPTLQRGGEVGDDVTEQVVGDDDLELARVAHHLENDVVDVKRTRFDYGKFALQLGEGAPPQAMAMVLMALVLSATDQLYRARSLSACWNAAPGEPRSTPFRDVEFLFDGNFVGGAGFEAAANAGVEAFGVLAKDDEVNVFRLAIFQRHEFVGKREARPGN